MSIDKIAGGLFGGDKADKTYKQQKQAMAKQSQYLDQEAGLYNELGAIGREQLDYYQKTYRPVEEKFVAKSAEPVLPDYEGITDLSGQASHEVGRQYDIARESGVRDLTRRGSDPDSATFKSFQLSSRLGEAAAKSGAITRAKILEEDKKRTERKYADEMTYNRLGTATEVGRGVQAGATRGLSAAAGGIGNVAAGYGSQAGEYGKIAGEQADAAGGLASSLFSLGTKLYLGSLGVPPVA